MNIKEVEHLTEISSQNIRFYEKAGLICPMRNPDNGYREYTEEDVRTLKLIKMFRMLDMPLEKIKRVLHGEETLDSSLEEQQAILAKKIQDAQYAITVCEKLRKEQGGVADIPVDAYLENMGAEPKQFFREWLSDYKAVVQYEHERTFTFTPDNEITNQYDFENALYDYARQQNKEIVITKRGMYPEFILDGVAYTAERNYVRSYYVPVAVVRCTRKDSVEDAKVYSHGRKKWIRFVHILLPVIFFALFLFLLTLSQSEESLFSSWEGWVLVLTFLALFAITVFRNYFLYWNRKHEYEDKK